jgi:hypothetical protein
MTCTGVPSAFNIMVQETGMPVQWLSEVDVPGLATGEDFYGYEKLPLITSKNNAAVFSTNSYRNLVSQAHIKGKTGLTTVYGAVRASTMGNSNVQLYPSYHLAADMMNYTVSINGQCQLALAVRGATLESGILHRVL